jgi:hypothetical protein
MNQQKQVRQLIQYKLGIVWLWLVLIGCLLGTSSVQAHNQINLLANNQTGEMAIPHQQTIIVNGGGQGAIYRAVKSARPGDIVLVKAGNYDDGDPQTPLEFSVSGTAAAPITIMGENRPKIGNVKFDGANYLILQNFEIANQTSKEYFTGIKVRDSSFITIRDLLIHHLNANAISVGEGSTDVTVENSKMYELIPRQNDMDAYCLSNSTAKNITFRNSECFGFIGDGFQAWSAADGVLYDRGTTIIEGNKIYNTKGACSENAIDIKAESGTVIIRNNTLFGFKGMKPSECTLHATGCYACAAIEIHQDGIGPILIEGNKIFDSDAAIGNTRMKAVIQNNLFYNIRLFTLSDRGSSSKYYHNTFVNTGMVFTKASSNPKEVINNLFYNAGGTVNGNYHHNGWFGTNQRRSGTGDVTGSNPRLNADYTLSASSLLIDKGAVLNITTDLTGRQGIRPTGSAPDIGAFEFTGTPRTEATVLDPIEALPDPLALAFDGPTSVVPGETFNVSVQAQGVAEPGLYGAQLEINYDPNLLSVNNLQINPDLSFVVQNNIDPTTGKIRLAASRQGNVAGLSGDVTLVSFEATAANSTGAVSLTIDNVKVGDAQANPLPITTRGYNVLIQEPQPPEPTDQPEPEPTAEPTPIPTDEPTPAPTDQPLPTPTYQPTPAPTDLPTPITPESPVPTPSPQPTDLPTTEPTDQPEPTPTNPPTAEPTDQPSPEPTPEPAPNDISGQVMLLGRAENNWSGAVVSVDNNQATATTDATGRFALTNVALGAHTIAADAPGYLPAVCSANISQLPTSLTPVALLSGDINDDGKVDIGDATTVGVSFNKNEPGLPADLNHDGSVDIYDIILVSVNFGQEGQIWNCQAQPLASANANG